MGRRMAATMALIAVLLSSCAAKHAAAPPTTSVSPTVDPATGWFVHRSAWEGATFLYPRNWTADVRLESLGDGSAATLRDTVRLTSPSGFTVNWVAPLVGLGGGCDKSKEPHIFVDRILPTPTDGSVNPLSILLLSVEGHKVLAVVDRTSFANKTLKIGDMGDCMYYPVLQSKRNYLAQFMTSGAVQLDHFSEPRDGSEKLTDDQYLALPDAQAALQILRSLRY